MVFFASLRMTGYDRIKPMKRPSSQRGSAILMIFIAVALFGALAYAFMQGTRTSTTMMTSEGEKVSAADTQDYVNSVNTAVKRLKLRGCTDAQISYETPLGNNVNTAAPADKHCHIFHMAGAGIKYRGADLAPKKVFVTSTTHAGATMGGMAGADGICAARASAAGVTGAFKAWVSTGRPTPSPSTTFTQSSIPYSLVDGTKIADDWADLIDGTLDAPINKNENGVTIASGEVWTGTNSDGTGAGNPMSGSLTCSGWNGGSPIGTIGDLASSAVAWSSLGSGLGCAIARHLYCFEQ